MPARPLHLVSTQPSSLRGLLRKLWPDFVHPIALAWPAAAEPVARCGLGHCTSTCLGTLAMVVDGRTRCRSECSIRGRVLSRSMRSGRTNGGLDKSAFGAYDVLMFRGSESLREHFGATSLAPRGLNRLCERVRAIGHEFGLISANRSISTHVAPVTRHGSLSRR